MANDALNSPNLVPQSFYSSLSPHTVNRVQYSHVSASNYIQASMLLWSVMQGRFEGEGWPNRLPPPQHRKRRPCCWVVCLRPVSLSLCRGLSQLSERVAFRISVGGCRRCGLMTHVADRAAASHNQLITSEISTKC